jgi:SAM-dependent methyltransferase
LTTSKKSYLKLASHYQECLDKHGDTPSGMDWPKAKDNLVRHQMMLELFSEAAQKSARPVRVLDFGCGTSHFYDYLVKEGFKKKVTYIGIDILAESVAIAKKKHPGNRYFCLDILSPGVKIPAFDFVVINGLFTQRRSISDKQMRGFLGKIITRLFSEARRGLAFNTLSDQVDFKRPGSFHLNLDWAGKFFTKHLTRNFVVRHDYGLYENTFYLYKKQVGK